MGRYQCGDQIFVISANIDRRPGGRRFAQKLGIGFSRFEKINEFLSHDIIKALHYVAGLFLSLSGFVIPDNWRPLAARPNTLKTCLPARPSPPRLVTLCASPEPFSESAINALFHACIAASGVEWETPRSLDLVERLWYSDNVLAAIEALQETHEANRDIVFGPPALAGDD